MDIVELLHLPIKRGGATSEDAYEVYDDLRIEAADEIERLRAALDIARTALLTIERRCEEYRAQITRTIEQHVQRMQV